MVAASIAINGTIFHQASTYLGEQYMQGGTVYSPLMATNAYTDGQNGLYDRASVVSPLTLSLTAIQSLTLSSSGAGFFKYNGENLILTDNYVTVTEGPPPPTVPEPSLLAVLGGSILVLNLTFGMRRAI